jgi:repressor of nif and glnA expression
MRIDPSRAASEPDLFTFSRRPNSLGEAVKFELKPRGVNFAPDISTAGSLLKAGEGAVFANIRLRVGTPAPAACRNDLRDQELRTIIPLRPLSRIAPLTIEAQVE